MSGLLVFRWLAPVFALAVAATVWVVGGPMAAGLCMIAFLLGVVTCELHHMRWTPVDEPVAAGASDSAFLALMAAEKAGPPGEVDPTPVAPPAPPKRNFRLTCQGLAIGSGEIRLELVERLHLHRNAASQRRAGARPEAAPSPEPVQPESAPAPTAESGSAAQAEPEAVLQLEADMVELLLVPAAGLRPEPPGEAQGEAAAPSLRPARANEDVPPPRVTVLASPERKRVASEAFRSSYVTRAPR